MRKGIRKYFVITLIALFCLTGLTYALDKVDVVALHIKVLSSTTTVADTATAIPATAMRGRRNITIRLNDVSDTVYIGHSAVSTTNGFALDSSCPAVSLDVDDSVVMYGRVATGTADVRCLEVK